MMGRAARRALLFFILLGLGASLTSTVVHYRLVQEPGYASFCDISSTVSCSQVYLSRFGQLWGVPVALLGTLWFMLVFVLAITPGGGPTAFRENVPAYLFVLSTLALAAVLYLAYASFFVLKTFCILCGAVYVAVAGTFLVSGAATTFPMSRLPRRAWRDLGALVATPLASLIAALLVAAAASAVAFFPREGPVGGAQRGAPASENLVQQFQEWWRVQPRVQLPVAADGAKVLVVKFNDYQCPPCRQTYLDYRDILARYQAAHPGAVRFLTKDYPLDPECNQHTPAGTHLAACEAAVAVRLARTASRGEQLEQWLFANQESLSPARVKGAVRDIAGVQDFDTRYAQIVEAVKADIALGRLLQVEGTPTFFINGVRVRGGLPPELFDAAIAMELGQAR